MNWINTDQEHISTDHREHLGRWSEAVATMVGSVLPELKGILQELKTTAVDNVATVAGPRLEAILSVASTQLASLRSEVNSELNFPPNFEGLVLGCIDADFCK